MSERRAVRRRSVRTALVAIGAAVALALSPAVIAHAAPAAAPAAAHTAAAPAPVTYPLPVPDTTTLTVNAAGTTAYVLQGSTPARGRGVLRVLDLPTGRVVADVPLGTYPSDVVLDEPRHRAYVSDFESGVWVVDLTTNRVERVWPVRATDELALSPDGRSLWATAPGPFAKPSSVLVIDPTTGTVTTTLRVRLAPYSPVFTPDGRKLYVQDSSYEGDQPVPPTVSVIDTATRTVIRTVTVPPALLDASLVMDPTGSRVLVTDPVADLATIDTATDRVVASPPGLVGSFVFDARGHLVQFLTPGFEDVFGTYRVRDAATFVPITPLRDLPGQRAGGVVGPDGLLVLLTSTVREALSTVSFDSITVIDPLQAITASTLPRQEALAGPSTTVPFTVSQTRPQSPTTIALASAITGRRLGAAVVTPDGNGRLTGSVTFPSRDSDRGPLVWTLPAGAGTSVDVQNTYLRSRSLLATAVTRRGDLVDVVGSAKAWTSGGNTYVGSAGRPVVLQRYTSTGWQRVYSLTTDRLGHVATTRRIPFRVALRLVAVDTTTAAAVTSNEVVR